MLALMLGGLSYAASSQAATLTVTSAGIHIDAGAFGSLVLSYPLLNTGQAEPLKPLGQTLEGNRAILTYSGGARVEVSIGAAGAVMYRFANPPAALKSYQMEMLADFGFTEGGSWRMGEDNARGSPLLLVKRNCERTAASKKKFVYFYFTAHRRRSAHSTSHRYG